MTRALEPPVKVAGVTVQVEVEVTVTARRFGPLRLFAGEKTPVAVKIGEGAGAVWVRLDEEETPAEAGVD